ncbi:DUF2188 domain-containing protein [Cupriavidus cauae]|uniref:DUF2188 domain-containing protein n=1 Tax=Cupriavidus cauae TaxID=2608999 RepID=A0A5M8B8Y1_9BURK|nr:DUF2188 domain-containing protein [Cupriavidus cauae]KAA0179733.1 DUF2188 domain-containing protein [Cupriavidus gilardii]KAA6130956.1 DUF2188 domain-containing protein [Cupriavidus cauae]
MAGNVHVVPEADGKWAVRIEGTDGTGPTYETQQEAIASGTEAAQQAKVELIIHGRDGQIRERNSFGNDPRDIKG